MSTPFCSTRVAKVWRNNATDLTVEDSAEHLFDNEHIRACYADLEHFHAVLSLEESDRLFSLVARLCTEYERTAFTEGIHVGVQLMEELRA